MARGESEEEGDVLDLPPLTSENEEESGSSDFSGESPRPEVPLN
jgi:hypothetical protein